MSATDKNQRKTIDITKLLGIVAGIGSFIVFYFWVAGRLYAGGYFFALNIPSYMVNFQTWEYIEQSWYRLLSFFIVYAFIGVVLNAIGSILWFWLGLLFSKARDFLSRYIKWPKSKFKIPFPDLEQYRRELVFLFKIIVVLLLFSILFSYAIIIGITNGNRYLLSAPSIEIITSKNIKLDVLGMPYDSQHGLYTYSNLKLLTYNQGKYYVFSGIDKTTCKPKNVFVIDEGNIESANIGISTSSPIPECEVKTVGFWPLMIPINIPKALLLQ